ncbi:MAG TPA: hypothetical protein VMM78_03865, partial [Thermomicrobiales bacterium]|nr:hypothetical protein [Thermomicrobiales bacterium]
MAFEDRRYDGVLVWAIRAMRCLAQPVDAFVRQQPDEEPVAPPIDFNLDDLDAHDAHCDPQPPFATRR